MDLEQTQALERALELLSEDYRRVIHLRYREERSFEEIAQVMQRSQNAVRKLWRRAHERLQETLEPLYEFEPKLGARPGTD